MANKQTKLYLDNNFLFWTLQFAGWSGLALLMYVMYTLTYNQTELPYLLHPFVQSILGILVSWPMRGIFHRSWDKNNLLKLVIVVATILGFSLLWTILRLVSFIWMTGEEKNFLPEFGLWYFPGILVFSCWVAFYHGFRYYRLFQEERVVIHQLEIENREALLRKEEAEKLAKEAQLKMLQYQLNPHFLFNSMNAITALVKSGQNEAASTMIDSLSSFLRNSLAADPLRRITIREEIDALKTYLEIEQIRFGDRLDFEFRVSEDTLDLRLPSLIVQPLAENVIKHAVRPAIDVLKMTVTTYTENDQLVVEVDDTGPGIKDLVDGQLPGEGTGLSNVRNRLQNMYDSGGIRLVQKAEGGLRVILNIPVAKNE
jgi:sensor histidine kinase YesM